MVTSPHHEAISEPTKSHFTRTKNTPVSQEIPKDFRSSASGTGVKDQLLEQKILLVLLGNYSSFRSSEPGTGGRYIFYITHVYTGCWQNLSYDCRNCILDFLLAASQRPLSALEVFSFLPCCPLLRPSPTMAAYFKASRRARASLLTKCFLI